MNDASEVMLTDFVQDAIFVAKCCWILHVLSWYARVAVWPGLRRLSGRFLLTWGWPVRRVLRYISEKRTSGNGSPNSPVPNLVCTLNNDDL